TELETCLGQFVVPLLCPGVTLGDVRGVRGQFVGDHTRLDVVPVGQTQVLLRGDIAKHRGAVPTDLGGPDRRGDVVITGGHVGGERAEGVERGLPAEFLLQRHVLLDLVHGDMAGTFDHHLYVVGTGDVG